MLKISNSYQSYHSYQIMGFVRSYDVRLFQKLPRLPELPKLCGSSEVKMLDTFKSYQNYHSYQYYGVFQKSWCNRHFQKLPSINECSDDNWTHTEVTLVTSITKISRDFFQKKLWHVSNHYCCCRTALSFTAKASFFCTHLTHGTRACF